MTASADLWDSIRGPLEESRWFVAVISPAAAASPGVTREIAWWVENRGDDQLLVVLADGTCLWDMDVNDWAADATAVPEALRGAFDAEPRWVDATWTADQPLERRDGRLVDLLAELAAPVQGTTKDAIVGEELRQHRRTVRTAVSAAALLLVLTIAAVIGALIALDQRDNAESHRQQALSQSLAAQAADIGARRPDLGILLGVEAWRHAHTSQAEQALMTSAKLEGQIPRVISPEWPRWPSGIRPSTIRLSSSAKMAWSSVGAMATNRAGLARACTIRGFRRCCNSVRSRSACRGVARCTSSMTRCTRSPVTGRFRPARAGPRWAPTGRGRPRSR